jgi:hypothetical protein
MIELYNFFPRSRIAGNAATDEHGSHMGVFQPALPGSPDVMACSIRPRRSLRTETELLQCAVRYVRVPRKVLAFNTGIVAASLGQSERTANQMPRLDQPVEPTPGGGGGRRRR